MLRRTASILGQRNSFADGHFTYLVERRVRTFWRPPQKGWNTYNVGAHFPMAVKGKFGKPACSCIEINEARKLRLWQCRDIPDAISSEHAKLLACFEGMKIAISCGVKKLSLESDCEAVVNKFLGVERTQSGDDLYTYCEIWNMMNCFDDFEIKVIDQEDNSVAELVATRLAYAMPLEEAYINVAVTKGFDRPHWLRQLRQKRTLLPLSWDGPD